MSDRLLGDFLAPDRPGRVIHLVNTATRECGTDAKAWTVDRLVNFVAQLEREARQRRNAE